MTKKTMQVPCPVCKTSVKLRSDDFPFCSPRCKTIDLGNWASNGYAIPDNNPDFSGELADELESALADESTDCSDEKPTLH
ncbi:MAG: DNA gyrase inhibitor YacG [Ghiorsea sp.]